MSGWAFERDRNLVGALVGRRSRRRGGPSQQPELGSEDLAAYVAPLRAEGVGGDGAGATPALLRRRSTTRCDAS
jgi:hypothetical protein